MSIFKILLLVLLSALVLTLAVVGYFFYKVYQLQHATEGVVPYTTQSTGTSSIGVEDTTASVEEPVTVGQYTVPETGFVIQVDSLPEGQQSAARAMGFADTIVLTPEVVSCAVARIGQERVTAISDGAAPTLMESVALLGCI